MDSKFQSELDVLDTDDVKQRTSLFSVLRKSAFIGPVSWFFVLLFYVICAQEKIIPKLPSQPSCPPIYYMNKLFIMNVN